MKKALLFLVLAVVLLSSCTEEQMLNQRERRIGGTWKFETAYLSTNSVYFPGFFEGDLITFHDDNTVFLENNVEGAAFEGEWLMEVRNEEGHEDCPVTYLDFQFEDHVRDQVFSYTAEVTLMTHRKMKMTIITDEGEFKCKLLKQ
ncbi:MAG: hypothetical protein AAFO69_12475 [Bacteroidota bacterium]